MRESPFFADGCNSNVYRNPLFEIPGLEVEVMKIVLFGATGNVGRRVAAAAGGLASPTEYRRKGRTEP